MRGLRPCVRSTKLLETALDEEFNRPLPDDIQIASLKKQKLRIKDEIASLTRK